MKKITLFLACILLSCISMAQPAADIELSVPDVMPEFSGSTVEMFKFINSKMTYSDEDIVNKVTGELILTFVVDTAGIISGIEIKKGVSTKIDLAIMRIVQSMPAWIPGRVNRQNVNSKVSLAIMVTAEQQSAGPIFR